MKKPALSSSTKCYSTCKVDFVNVVGIYFFRLDISEDNPASEWDVTCLSAIKTKQAHRAADENRTHNIGIISAWSNCIIHHWEKWTRTQGKVYTASCFLALPLSYCGIKSHYWSGSDHTRKCGEERDSHIPSDVISGPVIAPLSITQHQGKGERLLLFTKIGFEPMTYWLRINCTNHCTILWSKSFKHRWCFLASKKREKELGNTR